MAFIWSESSPRDHFSSYRSPTNTFQIQNHSDSLAIIASLSSKQTTSMRVIVKEAIFVAMKKMYCICRGVNYGVVCLGAKNVSFKHIS